MPRVHRFLAPGLLLLAAACSDDSTQVVPESDNEYQSVPISLHGTADGMGYWYQASLGGYEKLTGIPYKHLQCGKCHVGPGGNQGQHICLDCHSDTRPGEELVSVTKCLSCHSRQASEIQMGVPDVHRAAGMECWDCHSHQEIHGDGQAYNSFLETPSPRCEDCHKTVPSSQAHTVHGNKLNCASCHMATATTCYNCHFDTEIKQGKKDAYRKVNGWQFLANYRGQVYPFNFQSVEYEGKTFVAIGPFSGHTITKAARPCADCHNGPAMQELAATGKIQIAKWDPATNQLVFRKGVVPIPMTFKTTLQFDFVDKVTGTTTWRFLESGADDMQMLFGTPLTDAQMNKLKQ
jgi:hypothetical protein